MFRKDINAARALAVILVVLFHFEIPGFKGGFIGVDIFFVISGYLMTKIIVNNLSNNSFNYAEFLAARIVRIWPAHIFLIIFIFATAAFLLPPFDYAYFSKQAKYALLFYSNIYFKEGQGYFNNGIDERLLLHTWSLAIEWQFYMLYPLYLLVIDKFYFGNNFIKSINRNKIYMISIGLLLSISLLLSIFYKTNIHSTKFFGLLFRMWEMAAGGLLLYLEPKLSELSDKKIDIIRIISLLIVVGVLIGAEDGSWESKWPGSLALWPVAGGILFLIGKNKGSKVTCYCINLIFVQSIGRWSYSIYLWHWPIFVTINFLNFQSRERIIAKIIGILISIIIGSVSYKFIESNFKFHKNFYQSFTRGALLICFLGASIGLLIAISVENSNGWIQRVGKDKNYYELNSEARKEKVIPENCANFKKSIDNIIICKINAEVSGSRVLVIGDSHAQHLYAWFYAKAPYGVDFLTSSGCPPLRGFNRKESGYFCDSYTNLAFKKAALPLYDTVVIAGYYGYTVDRLLKGMCRSGNKCTLVPSDREIIENITKDDWEILLKLGKKLVILDQVPVASSRIPELTSRTLWTTGQRIETFTDIQYSLDGSPSFVRSIFNTLKTYKNIEIISLRDYFCLGKTCQIFEDDIPSPILIDTNHLNPVWIRRHGDIFYKVIHANNF